MSKFCGSLGRLTRATWRARCGTRWPRGQNVNFYHLIGAKSSKDNVALATAHEVAAEYFKETSIYQVKNLNAYARQLKVL